MLRKTMTNVKVEEINPTSCVYGMPGGKTGLVYHHPGVFGFLTRFDIQVGHTYSIIQAVVAYSRSQREIYEWVEVLDNAPKRVDAEVVPAKNNLLEY